MNQRGRIQTGVSRIILCGLCAGMLAFAAAASAQEPEVREALRAIERQQFVAQLWQQGDAAVYVSPARGFVLTVKGHENLVALQYPHLDVSGLEPIEIETSTDLAYLIAEVEPVEGDQQILVKAECQRRTNPCKDGCYETPPVEGRRYSNKDSNRVHPHGKCERIEDDEYEGSCTQTYTKMCDRQKYFGAACNQLLSSESVYAWHCSP